ncbi:MAG: hypothetical protein V3T30_02445 [Thermodesulfobacteriota bacterium]
MQSFNVDLKKGIWMGLASGIVWGLSSMGINALTGAVHFESTVFHNLSSFTIGGAIFGIVVGAFFAVTKKVIPLKSILLKAVLLSVGIWVIIRVGALVFRHHANPTEALQGFMLAILMGLFLGILWKRDAARAA